MLRIAWAQVEPVERVVAAEPVVPVVPLISGGAAQAGPAEEALMVNRARREGPALVAKPAMRRRKTLSTTRTAGVLVEPAAAAVQQETPVAAEPPVAEEPAAAEPMHRGAITDPPGMAVLAALWAAAPEQVVSGIPGSADSIP
jgi:hypothetical protein